MTSPRVPAPVPAGKPVGRAVAGRPASGTNSSVAMLRVNPASYNPIAPKLVHHRERIFLAGDSTVGKSYIIFQMAEAEYRRHQADPDYPMARFFLLDLDAAAPAYLDELADFPHLYFENGGNVYPYDIGSYEDIAGASNHVISVQKPTRRDWIIVDPVDRFYEFVQDVVGRIPEIDVPDVQERAIERSIKRQGFGAFQADQWNIVGRVHDSLINSLWFNTPANLMLITHLTDYVDNREKRMTAVLFDNLGVKPKGRPILPDWCDTVVVLWATQYIPRDGNRRMAGVPSKIQRHMWIAKDRGRPFGFEKSMGSNFWESLQEARRSNLKPVSIDSPEQKAQLIASGEIQEDGDTDDNTDGGVVGSSRPQVPSMDGIDTDAPAGDNTEAAS